MDKETVSGILDDLKNRFGSRFIISFIIAWLIYNWKITVALFWYDKSQIKAEGFKSIFDFIGSQLSNNPKIDETLYTALIFTFGIPISKGIINIYDAIILSLRNWVKTKILKNEFIDKISRLESDLSKISDGKILNGNWKVKTKSEYTSSMKNYELYIEDYTIYHLVGNEKNLNSNITNFFYDSNRKQMTFTKDNNNTNGNVRFESRYAVNNLRVEIEDNNRIILTGSENGHEIEYKKYRHQL
jgi:hypothetical protein